MDSCDGNKSGATLEHLAAEAARGDRSALTEILRVAAPTVRRLAHALFRGANRSDAEDLAQDALLSFVRSLHTYRGECSVLHFMKRITVRRMLDLRHRMKRSECVRRDFESGQVRRDPTVPVPLGHVLRDEVGHLVRTALDELPAAQKETAILRWVCGDSLEDIAQITCVPVNTVRSRLRLAKDTLRRHLGDHSVVRDMRGVPSAG